MLSRHHILAGAAAFVAIGLGGTAYAESSLTEIDPSVLAGTCANCHGPDGRSPGAIPSIAGIPFEILLAQLQAFKAGSVPGTTVMTRIATGYSDEELEALARYFSEIEP